MKKIAGILLVCLFLLSGCGIIGSGKQVGYISAVDTHAINGILYIKPDLTSTQEDCYVVEGNNANLMNSATRYMETKTKVELNYNRHFFAWSLPCEINEVIVSIEEIK